MLTRFRNYKTIQGTPTEREPEDFPYSYTRFCIFKYGWKQADPVVFTDRLSKLYEEKYDKLFKRYLGDGQYYSTKNPISIEKFLSNLLGKRLMLTGIEEECNASTGYPYWLLYYREKGDIRMGTSITARNSTYRFDCGGYGFFNLRKAIAYAMDKEFGENYFNLVSCHTKEDYENHDKIANRILQEKGLDEDVVDFLYQDDGKGKVNYKTCKKIYDLIKDIDYSGRGFRYAVYRHNDYDEFKEFLLECYKKHRNMVWY